MLGDMNADHFASEWSQFVAAHPQGHVLQTVEWGRLKSEFGWYDKRVLVRDGEAIVAGTQVLFRRLPFGWALAYVPKGPLVDFSRFDVCQRLYEGMHQECRSQHAILLKIEPDLFTSDDLAARLAKGGFGPSEQTIQPRRTILVDISGSEDEILKRMKSKTRYNIRLALRKGVQVYEGGKDDLEAFNRLMAVTGKRDAFGVRSPAYYERAYDALSSSDMVRLFIATVEAQPVAGLMAFACGQKAVYMYGVSGDEYREKMPTYALQWATIRWARSRGCTTYDLYGVPDEDLDVLEAQFTERRDGLWGVYRFKRGFGGRLVRYAGAFDYVYNKPLYWLYHMMLKMRR
jgi:lipid II:glycine glycyltransferase (peptidoglycan interpeptide bridge formation enzyme)